MNSLVLKVRKTWDIRKKPQHQKLTFKALTYIIVINTSRHDMMSEKDDGGSEKQYAHKNSRNKSKLAFYKFFLTSHRSTNNHLYFQFSLHL